jgi:hypothetical protein
MPKFAKIFNLWALELGQKQKAMCSIASLTGRARTGHGSARPARGRPALRACVVPSPINASRGLSHWHLHTPSLARARDHRSSPWKASTAARHLCPSSAIVASLFCWTPASPQPLDRFPVKPWSFSKLEPRHCLIGEAVSPSPDFGLPSPRVDRANQWVFFQFLAPTSYLASREALWPVQLIYRAVSRPDSSPPTSISARARGPADSDHPRRRPAHHRDPRDLPYVLGHLTGASSPPISPSATFFSAATVPLGKDRRFDF